MQSRANLGREGGRPEDRQRARRSGAPRNRPSPRSAAPTVDREPDIERQLDEALEGTFPASDPVALPLRAD
jgi:hypothetical protein